MHKFACSLEERLFGASGDAACFGLNPTTAGNRGSNISDVLQSVLTTLGIARKESALRGTRDRKLVSRL